MSLLAILGLFAVMAVPVSAWLYYEANEGSRPFLALVVYVVWTAGTVAATVFGIFFY